MKTILISIIAVIGLSACIGQPYVAPDCVKEPIQIACRGPQGEGDGSGGGEQ